MVYPMHKGLFETEEGISSQGTLRKKHEYERKLFFTKMRNFWRFLPIIRLGDIPLV